MDDLELEETEWIPKLYVVTRADLPPGAQACQALHAAREFAEQFPNVEKEWYKTSNHICILSVKDEMELSSLIREASGEELMYSCFWEPDFNNALTAACFSPTIESRLFLKDLPLALRQNWYGGVKH